MVGFVLGLGDRHSSNILVDTRLAELVHIDLGVAFDQGRLLRTPECVPFRLTRDVEDGFGISGVDGVFRGAAEQTMRALRANCQSLVTILQVFVRNPLYRWACDPIHTLDDASTCSTASSGVHDSSLRREATKMTNGVMCNREAERALLRIQDKLFGRKAGSNESLVVEGQVQILLDEARDPQNLCRMYDGWAAWL